MSIKIQNSSEQAIQEAAEIIRAGGLVITPTNTNYNIVCDPFNIDAVRKIFNVKKRTKFGPLTLILSSVEKIPDYTLPTSSFSMEIANSLWPGEVSFILYKQPFIPDAVTCGAKTVAVANHDHPVLQKLIKLVGQPVCASSANISGQGDIHVDVNKAVADLSSDVSLILNDGPTKATYSTSNHKSNTIVDFSFTPPYLVREGLVDQDKLIKYIPNLITDINSYSTVLQKRLYSENLTMSK